MIEEEFNEPISSENLNKQFRKKAIALLEKIKESHKNKPVKYVPMGFSYDFKKLKECEKEKNRKKIL